MNFEFSEDITRMREEVSKFLEEQLPPGAVRKQIETGAPLDRVLWSKLAEMGWLGVAIPENFGGVELGYEALCMIAEEMGRALPPVPFSSSIYLAAQAILEFGSEAQKHKLLPGFADGSCIGAFALAEGPGDPAPAGIRAHVEAGRLYGTKFPVPDGAAADYLVAAARAPNGDIALYGVDLHGAGVTRRPLATLDLGHPTVAIDFDGAPAEMLQEAPDWSAVTRLLDRAAILFAFEQVGGAQGALTQALNYAMGRFAFGKPIAALQAIKHKLADMYVATELARSNAYFGAWALEANAAELTAAAAAARLSATDAYHLAAKENIQIHGGMGFTWEADCHLYYRRSKQLAGNLGSARYWRNRLIDTITAQNDREAA